MDLTEEQVIDEYIIPYVRRQVLICNGRRLLFEDIERVRITKTPGPAARFEAAILAEWDAAGKKTAAMPPISLIAAERGTDVSDNLLRTYSAREFGTAGTAGMRWDNMEKDSRCVMVVYGRDAKAKAAVFSFLRALDLRPIEWADAVRATGVASPYIGQVLDTAFALAAAVVVLLTPDDEVRLRDSLHGSDEPDYERKMTHQARPNVLFEAGMALGRHPERTILVEMGKLRPFSDVAGRHTLRMSNAADRRNDLATRLKTAGCAVKTEGSDWLTAGDFEKLS